jgi:rod shape-determining protein MreB
MLDQLLQRFRCDLAVDLGTATTLVAVAGEGIVLDEPSVVALDADSGKILSGGTAVGQFARQMQGRTPDSIRVERPLREGVITDFELCEAMLRHLMRKAQPPGRRLRPRVLLAVPGRITPVERRAAFGSTLRAGAGRVWLLDEAKAAAIGCGLPVAEPLASTVCDIGGGTTEVAVMSLADTVASASIRTGGDAMDQALVDYLRRHYSLRASLSAAERLRIEAGSAWPLDEERSQEVTGLDTVSGLPRRASITTEEVRQALAEPLEQIVEAIQQVIDRCGPDLAEDVVQRGLILCGGGSLLAGLDRYLTERTGIPTRRAPRPRTAVVEGLLLALEQFDRWRANLQSSEDDAA